MLFPSLLLTKLDDAAKWTGEVKAFAVYFSKDCLPEERLGTVYAARKTFEDGTTVTLIDSAAINRHPTMVMVRHGDGLIERDAFGSATFVRIRFSPGGGPTVAQIEFRPDPKNKERLASSYTTPRSTRGELSLARESYLIDPIEALAFEPQTLQMGGNLPFANFTNGATAGMNIISGRYSPSQRRPMIVDFAGRREVFNVVTLALTSTVPPIVATPDIMGRLLFHSDGSLAAYVQSNSSAPTQIGLFGSASKGTAAPLAGVANSRIPDVLRGRLNGEPLIDELGFGPFLVPTEVSPAEQSAVLAEVPAPEPKASEVQVRSELKE